MAFRLQAVSMISWNLPTVTIIQAMLSSCNFSKPYFWLCNQSSTLVYYHGIPDKVCNCYQTEIIKDDAQI